MHKFTDAKGREWRLSLTYGAFQQIKEDLGLDFLDVKQGGVAISKLGFDVTQFVNMLFVLCEEQAKEAAIDDAGFGRGLDGESLKGALDAFLAEYLDFFRFSQETQDLLTATLGQATAATKTATKMALEMINSPETMEGIQKALESQRPSIAGAIATALKESQD